MASDLSINKWVFFDNEISRYFRLHQRHGIRRTNTMSVQILLSQYQYSYTRPLSVHHFVSRLCARPSIFVRVVWYAWCYVSTCFLCILFCVYICICMVSVHIYVYVCVYIYVYVYVCMCKCMYVCVYMCMCMYVYVYICLYVYLYVVGTMYIYCYNYFMYIC